ncbi:CRISPR system precrRNA processing endoribonuclease RAMP protein Cas6 [Acidianus sulfidivorans JP7]|uniref:CRISPR-associated endoribonuclease Cas6 n=1 Tax=Acidianus sulfidivorans JP7 TaxID=619593 RepID=A0A2U9IJB6_9CREN|nr:CRISPR system precrRNA processing endoribonuclease RAMP protein Cas6 [Acidianus sulfidivorans]AWR96113.1 CRISPR system precrRNA processing endoribonuclease RAMP protein Cas6 [Acidianus sulfidivorans JP7]
MIVAEVFVRPENDAIIPFSSKIGKSLLLDPKNVSISPLKFKGKYLVKYASLPTYLEVTGGNIYSFEIGGEEKEVYSVLINLDSRYFFNTFWKVIDVKVHDIKVNSMPKKFEVEIMTPALIVSPYIKEKRKVFTNKSEYVFFTNLVDVTGLNREKLVEIIPKFSRLLWEEPSIMKYANLRYDDKLVLGLTGNLRYSVREEDEILIKVLENAIAMGIGSSRRNGFGVIRIKGVDVSWSR